MDTIYLDHAATTPVDGRVKAAMLPYLDQEFGNPSSVHRGGQRAEAALENAREQVAAVLGCQAEEVIFTSCGSESDNLALRGAGMAVRARTGANRLVSSRVEHPAVTRTLEQMAALYGFSAAWVAVDEHGAVQPDALQAALAPDVALVSLMYANNEIGTLNPVPELARRCRAGGILFHTDAVQAVAYLPVDVDALGVDLASLGSHKFYGPKGVGVLYRRKGTPLVPAQTGGGQEFGMRAGTQNVAYIVGFAEALRLTALERERRVAHVLPLRERIIGRVLEEIPAVRLTGHAQERLPNHASFAFDGLDGNLLLTLLDAEGFACSSGSACKTGSPEPSAVLSAIGLPRSWALGSLRVTVGTQTSAAQVDAFLNVLPGLVEKARQLK